MAHNSGLDLLKRYGISLKEFKENKDKTYFGLLNTKPNGEPLDNDVANEIMAPYFFAVDKFIKSRGGRSAYSSALQKAEIEHAEHFILGLLRNFIEFYGGRVSWPYRTYDPGSFENTRSLFGSLKSIIMEKNPWGKSTIPIPIPPPIYDSVVFPKPPNRPKLSTGKVNGLNIRPEPTTLATRRPKAPLTLTKINGVNASPPSAIPLTKNLLSPSSKNISRKIWTSNENDRARENARRGTIPLTKNLVSEINPPILPENNWESSAIPLTANIATGEVPITANMLGAAGAGKRAPYNPFNLISPTGAGKQLPYNPFNLIPPAGAGKRARRTRRRHK
jgi:hypothetical protein